MKFVLNTLILFSTLPCVACTLGRGETELSIQRVMRDFGPSITKADSAALHGLQSASNVDDTELTAAISGLDEAISCASAVLDDPSGPLLPSKLNQVPEANRPMYIKKFLDHMSHFRSGLIEYRKIYRDLLQAPMATRKYNDARTKSLDIQDRARAAHSDLG